MDLDALRGWRERQDPELRRPHRLPALAELIQLDDDEPVWRYSIRGPDVLLGRFHAQYAPVDLAFPSLRDHQSYRIGAPHAHLSFEEGIWKLQALSPRCETGLADEVLSHLHNPAPVEEGAIIRSGVTRFVFRRLDTTLESWAKARDELLEEVDEPALFLKRQGSVCGPRCLLNGADSQVLGRSHPAPGVLPDSSHWPVRDDAMWDLSGLCDHERKHVAFRHAAISRDRDRWTIRPLSSRQRTFVNRIAISGSVPLDAGDEIGLGSVLLRFHHPQKGEDQSQPRPVPTVIDWSEGRPPSTPTEEK